MKSQPLRCQWHWEIKINMKIFYMELFYMPEGNFTTEWNCVNNDCSLKRKKKNSRKPWFEVLWQGIVIKFSRKMSKSHDSITANSMTRIFEHDFKIFLQSAQNWSYLWSSTFNWHSLRNSVVTSASSSSSQFPGANNTFYETELWINIIIPSLIVRKISVAEW